MRTLHYVLLLSCFLGSSAAAVKEQGVQFNRDIRPIFSDKCYACHGPDASNRMTALRLDTEQGASIALSGNRTAIVPGEPDNSELYLRVASENVARRMPPAAAGHDPLAKHEIKLIREWIQQGGSWQGHWAFLPPEKPVVPEVRYPGWPVNPIDSFVLSHLDSVELEPASPAARETLIRRLSLDITGVPPTLREMDNFLEDQSPKAYEQAIDRLLASPRYGERMAVRWLDAARYADTNGYQTDAERDMWRWRDWVIDAFNSNKAFDEFTIEQLAGDMLPNASLDQIIATGFNRNHRGNGEGGIVAEEYAVEYVVDRVDTTSTIWLGLSLGCARCHDHKYDPITQQEYYQLFAYFNNVPENGKAFKYGNSPPFIKAPTTSQQKQLQELDSQLRNLQKQHQQLVKSHGQKQQQWENELAKQPLDWFDPRGRVITFPPDSEQPNATARIFKFGEFADLGDVANFGFYDRFSISAWIHPASANGAIVSRTGHVLPEEDTQSNPGWGFYLKDSRLQVNLVHRWLDDCLRIESKEPLELGEWHHVAFTYDGTRLANGITVYVNGQAVAVNVIRDEMNQEIKSKEPLRIGRGLGYDYQGQIQRLLIYDRSLDEAEIGMLSLDKSLDEIASIPSSSRKPAENHKLQQAYSNTFGSKDLTALTLKVRDFEQKRQEYYDSLPTVMVMQEMTSRRKTYRLDRGSYDAPTEEVKPGLPAALAKVDANNRLEFARWLVSRNNPLTARVTANRIWQMLWGMGIVRTVEDFGSQGEWPSHPELLDWLAVELMDSGWDIKALIKTIVMSAAYQQSSQLQEGLLERDPDNRLLSHGPRLRLPAEAVRDLSLSVSGLLVETIGGPSVNPYQPSGLWTELAGGEDYVMDQGENLYRRSLYTFWKRAVPPPSMMLFDSAGRETCEVRNVRTNTPLQALNRMNDVTYLETSQALAARALKEAVGQPDERLKHIFRLVTTRQPTASELNVLSGGFEYHLNRFRKDHEAAEGLLGQSQEPQADVSVPEMAAYAMMANLVLNLDETITRE